MRRRLRARRGRHVSKARVARKVVGRWTHQLAGNVGEETRAIESVLAIDEAPRDEHEH